MMMMMRPSRYRKYALLQITENFVASWINLNMSLVLRIESSSSQSSSRQRRSAYKDSSEKNCHARVEDTSMNSLPPRWPQRPWRPLTHLASYFFSGGYNLGRQECLAEKFMLSVRPAEQLVCWSSVYSMHIGRV